MTKKPAKSKELTIVWLIVSLIAIIGMMYTYRTFVGSPLPEKIIMASGHPSGAYHWYAKRYAELIEQKSGIAVEVRSTAGTEENLALLRDDASGVMLAFVQSGVAPEGITGVQALASVNEEPLWVFYRKNQVFHYLSDMTGKKISIGRQGGGTRPVALRLLRDNGVTADNAQLQDMGGAQAADALLQNALDVAFFVGALESADIQRLVKHPEIAFLDFTRYASYARRYDFLSAIALPQGLLSLEKNLPEQTVNLLAMRTIFVARDDLHPGLTPLLLEVAKRVHKGSSLMHAAGAFPSGDFNGLPGSRNATRFFTKGLPFLYGVLPFQWASTIDRLKVLAVPLLTLLLPLFKLTPPIYRWRMRAKIYRWYERVREQDLKMTETASRETLLEVLRSLKQLEQDLKKVKVPLSFMEELYQLQMHIGYLRGDVEKALS